MSGKLRFFKDKLDGYKKFFQIVKTIKMVTLAKYRQTVSRVKTRDLSLRYTEKMFGQDYDEEAIIKAATGTLLYIPITTNRGSCGSMNSSTLKYIETIISRRSKLLSVGKKGTDTLVKLYPGEITMSIINDMKQQQHFAYATYIYEHAQTFKDVERMQLIFTRFVTAGTQRQCVVNIPRYDVWMQGLNDAAATDKHKDRYMFANAVLHNEEQFIHDLYDFHATMAILGGTLENELSEYAARIVAVEGQLTNITSLQQKTGYLYNKTRQGSITSSLIEIISAMNAMESNVAKGVKRNRFWERPQRATTISSAKDAEADA